MAKTFQEQKQATAQELRSENAEALALIDAADAAHRPLTPAERAKVVELFHGAGGTVALSAEDFRSRKRAAETQQQYFTPTWMGKLMYELVGAPVDALFFDPAVGSGRMFYDFADKIYLTGVEKDRDVWRVGNAIFGMDPYKSRIHLINDDMKMHHYEGVADYALGNPPFNIPLADARGIIPSQFKGHKQAVRSDAVYLWSVIEALRFGGFAAVIVPPAVIDVVPNFSKWLEKQVDLLATVRLPAGQITEKSWSYDTVVFLFQKKALPETWGPGYFKMRKALLRTLVDDPSAYENAYGVRHDNEEFINEVVRASWPKDADKPTRPEIDVLVSFAAESFAKRVGSTPETIQFKRQPLDITFTGSAEPVKEAVFKAFGQRISAYKNGLEKREKPLLITAYDPLPAKVQSLIDEAEELAGREDIATAPPATPANIDTTLTPPPPPPPHQRHLSLALLAEEGRATGGAIVLPDSIETIALMAHMQMIGFETGRGLTGETGTSSHRNAFNDLQNNFLLYRANVIDALNANRIRPMFTTDDMERLREFVKWERRQQVPFTRRKRKKLKTGGYGEFADVPTPIAEEFAAELARNKAAVASLTTQGYKLLTLQQFVAAFWDAADTDGAAEFIEKAKAKDGESALKTQFTHVVVLPKNRLSEVLPAITSGEWPNRVQVVDGRDGDGNLIQRTVVLIRGEDRHAIAAKIDPLTKEPFRLYNYQRDDLAEMLLKDRILLAYQMGLGKTRTSIAYARAMRALDPKFRRTLVVCPAFLVDEWMLEMRELGIPESEVGVLKLEDVRTKMPSGAWAFDFGKWNLKPFNLLSMTELVPKDKAKPELNDVGEKTGRPLMVFDETAGKKAKKSVQGYVVKKKIKGHAPYVAPPRDVEAGEPLGKWVNEYFSIPSAEWPTAWLNAHGEIDLVIVDEAYKMKDANGDIAKGLRKLEPRKRMLLTGTPIKSIPAEGWSLFEWLLGGIPGAMNEFDRGNAGFAGYNKIFGTFIAELKEYTDKDGDVEYRPQISNQPSPAFSNIEFFQRAMATFMKRRLRAETLVTTPEGRAALAKAKDEKRWPHALTDEEKTIIGPMWDVPQVQDPQVVPVPLPMDVVTEEIYGELCKKFKKDFDEWVAAKRTGQFSDFNFQAEMGKMLSALITPQKRKSCSDLELAGAYIKLERLKQGWTPRGRGVYDYGTAVVGVAADESEAEANESETESEGEEAQGADDSTVIPVPPAVLAALARLSAAKAAEEKGKADGVDKAQQKKLREAREIAADEFDTVEKNEKRLAAESRVARLKANAEAVINRKDLKICGHTSIQQWIIDRVKEVVGRVNADGTPIVTLGSDGKPTNIGEDGKPRKVVLFVKEKVALQYYEGAFVQAGIPPIIVSGDDNLAPLKTTGISPRRTKIDAFRYKPTNNLLVATIDAMAEGVNLPEASIGLFDHWDWTPSKMKQAAFRMVRPAQKNQVRIWIPYFEYSVWEYAKFLNGYKAVSVEAAFDGDAVDVEGTNSMLRFYEFVEAIVNNRQEEFFKGVLQKLEQVNVTAGIDSEDSVTFVSPTKPVGTGDGAGFKRTPSHEALRYANSFDDALRDHALAVRDWYDSGRTGKMPWFRGRGWETANRINQRMKEIYSDVAPAAQVEKLTPAPERPSVLQPATPTDVVLTPVEPAQPPAPASGFTTQGSWHGSSGTGMIGGLGSTTANVPPELKEAMAKPESGQLDGMDVFTPNGQRARIVGREGDGVFLATVTLGGNYRVVRYPATIVRRAAQMRHPRARITIQGGDYAGQNATVMADPIYTDAGYTMTRVQLDSGEIVGIHQNNMPPADQPYNPPPEPAAGAPASPAKPAIRPELLNPHAATTARERWALNGLLQLAETDPDSARYINGVGFNKFDGHRGKDLLFRYSRYGSWTVPQWELAQNLARTYQRQIGMPPAVEDGEPDLLKKGVAEEVEVPAAPQASAAAVTPAGAVMPSATPSPVPAGRPASKAKFAKSTIGDPGFPDSWLIEADGELTPGNYVDVQRYQKPPRRRKVGDFVKQKGGAWFYTIAD